MTDQQNGNATKLLLVLSAVKLGIHLATASGYGYFRDEFYYLACSEHLAAGYVDQPPLSILLLWFSRKIIGDSLPALRFLPALAGALTVWFTGKIVRELGGSLFAILLAGLCIIAVPSYLANNHYFSMNSFDVLFWTIGSYLFIRILIRGLPRDWILLGFVLGLGLLNKISVLWFGAGIFAGLLLTPARKQFLTPWPWIAAAIAMILFSPYIVWQLQNDWPTLEFMRNATQEKMADTSAIDFILGQLTEMNPFLSPIWLIGLFFFFFHPIGKQYRACGWVYLTVFTILIVNQKSRSGYLAPAYPMLFAAGATTIATWIESFRLSWLKPVLSVFAVAAGVFVSPFAIPVLSVESYIDFANKMGEEPSTDENKEIGDLPQFYADMFGWNEQINELVRVWKTLSPADQKVCGIFGQNYGQAGAIDFLGRKRGLPEAISSHNNYWLWGPGRYTGECLLVLDSSEEEEKEHFEFVQTVGEIRCNHCMPYENNKNILLCKKLKMPIKEVWPQIKHYD